MVHIWVSTSRAFRKLQDAITSEAPSKRSIGLPPHSLFRLMSWPTRPKLGVFTAQASTKENLEPMTKPSFLYQALVIRVLTMGGSIAISFVDARRHAGSKTTVKQGDAVNRAAEPDI